MSLLFLTHGTLPLAPISTPFVVPPFHNCHLFSPFTSLASLFFVFKYLCVCSLSSLLPLKLHSLRLLTLIYPTFESSHLFTQMAPKSASQYAPHISRPRQSLDGSYGADSYRLVTFEGSHYTATTAQVELDSMRDWYGIPKSMRMTPPIIVVALSTMRGSLNMPSFISTGL